MNITLLLAHPQPGSFNHALADVCHHALTAAGHNVALHDLYAEGFDPRFTAAELKPLDNPPPAELEPWIAEIKAADGFIVVHPNWWGQPPAILKGWVDRVLRPGVAYRFGPGGVPEGLLKARAALVLNTANTPEAAENELFGDPLDNLWRNCTWRFCGLPQVERRVYRPVIVSTADQRGEWLADAADTARSLWPRE